MSSRPRPVVADSSEPLIGWSRQSARVALARELAADVAGLHRHPGSTCALKASLRGRGIHAARAQCHAFLATVAQLVPQLRIGQLRVHCRP